MRVIKKVLLALLIIVVIFGIASLFIINHLKPDYEGAREITTLKEEVNVYYDTYGIPHIYAENEADAFRTLGYVHAQDRLWQMELLRRVAKGRLSEVFGKDLIDTDKFFLSLGIDEHTLETVENLDHDTEMVQLSKAYLEGINTFIKEGPTPIEFYLTGIKKEPFTIHDIYDAVGYMAFSFAMAHKTDPLLTTIKNSLGEKYVHEFPVYSDSSTVWIKNFNNPQKDTVPVHLAASVRRALEKLPISQFEGSNSWVLAPEKTKNGKVILANDPHISFAQPSVWYEAHVNTPSYEKYGYHLAGVPFPLLGHDRNLAYGLTMFQNDDVDFYYEEINPSDSTQYKTESGWKSFEFVNKKIKIKGEETIEFVYKKTRHGPILNNLTPEITNQRPIAMSWIYTQITNKVINGLYGLSHAKNINDFSKSLPKIHAPGLNVMYGDAKGNVGWWATAKLYQMPDSLSTKFILDGTSGEQERLRFLDFSENPTAINPPWKYVYSANNQPDSISGILYPGYYLPQNRAKRIVALLDEKSDWEKEAVGAMMLDVTSSVNPGVITELIKLMDVSSFSGEQLVQLDALKNWRGNYPLESTSATFYHRFIYHILRNTFEDELGTDVFEQLLSTHLIKRHIAWGAKNREGIWWDNIKTKDKTETREEIAVKSFLEAWTSLVDDFGQDTSNWTWDKVHTIEHGHPIGRVALFRKYFNVGPFPVHGTREVINNMSFPYDSTGFYKVSSGPSTRRVIDFSDIENSISILPTGQSGNPFSKYYKDQAEMFVRGEYRKMMMNKEEIVEKASSRLIFKPNQN